MYKYLMLLFLLFAGASGAAPNGEKLYQEKCAACHGYDGMGGVGVPLALPNFQTDVTDEFLRKTIRYGRPGRVMPAFNTLSDAQIDAIVGHLRSWMPEGAEVRQPEGQIDGNPQRGKELFAQNCAACHGDKGQGGHGTGVTFSRPRDLPIIAPALNNVGFLAAASDAMIKATLMHGREGTPMVSFIEQGLSEQDIDDIVSYVRSFEQDPIQPHTFEGEEATMTMESPYDMEETLAAVKRAAIGKNFRIIRVQSMNDGMVPEGQESDKRIIVYFCNFSFINRVLALDPRLGLFMPCRITIVEDEKGQVTLNAMNPVYMAQAYNNDELGSACRDMKNTYTMIMEEATL